MLEVRKRGNYISSRVSAEPHSPSSLKHLEGHFNWVGGGEEVKKVSQKLQKTIEAINDPIKAFIGHNKEYVYAWKALLGSVCRVYADLAVDIVDFEKSLYKEKHAFYFRRVREWDDCNKVCLWIY